MIGAKNNISTDMRSRLTVPYPVTRCVANYIRIVITAIDREITMTSTKFVENVSTISDHG